MKSQQIVKWEFFLTAVFTAIVSGLIKESTHEEAVFDCIELCNWSGKAGPKTNKARSHSNKASHYLNKPRHHPNEARLQTRMATPHSKPHPNKANPHPNKTMLQTNKGTPHSNKTRLQTNETSYKTKLHHNKVIHHPDKEKFVIMQGLITNKVVSSKHGPDFFFKWGPCQNQIFTDGCTWAKQGCGTASYAYKNCDLIVSFIILFLWLPKECSEYLITTMTPFFKILSIFAWDYLI